MKSFFYKTITALLFSVSLYGQNITLNAPKVILKNIPFNVSFSGENINRDDLLLIVNKSVIVPSSNSKNTISFNQISISHLDGPIQLIDGNEILYQFTSTLISGWVSILPPLIAIILAFIYRTVVPALFAAIWYGAWAVSGFGFSTLIPSLLYMYESII